MYLCIIFVITIELQSASGKGAAELYGCRSGHVYRVFKVMSNPVVKIGFCQGRTGRYREAHVGTYMKILGSRFRGPKRALLCTYAPWGMEWAYCRYGERIAGRSGHHARRGPFNLAVTSPRGEPNQP